MFDDLNPQGFYPGENLPKLSKAEVLFFGLLRADGLNHLPAWSFTALWVSFGVR